MKIRMTNGKKFICQISERLESRLENIILFTGCWNTEEIFHTAFILFHNYFRKQYTVAGGSVAEQINILVLAGKLTNWTSRQNWDVQGISRDAVMDGQCSLYLEELRGTMQKVVVHCIAPGASSF